MTRLYSLFLLLMLAVTASHSYASGNEHNQSFNKAKRFLEQNVYTLTQRTLYCDAEFDIKKNITLPDGFHTTKYVKRARRVEAEHVVPAENFGRSFSEWRDGHAECVSNKGKAFKGRKCAEKMNTEYRYMQADAYNLFASIGSVNAQRQNYNFQMLPDAKSNFGSCDMRIQDRKVQPTERSRGIIARTYLYFDQAYSRYSLSRQQRQLFEAWDKQYPVTQWECERNQIIENWQGNKNPIMIERCTAANL